MQLNSAPINARAVNGAAYRHPRGDGALLGQIFAGATGRCLRRGFATATITLPVATGPVRMVRGARGQPGLLQLTASLSHAPVAKPLAGAAALTLSTYVTQTVARSGRGTATLPLLGTFYITKFVYGGGTATLTVRVDDTTGIEAGSGDGILRIGATLDGARRRHGGGTGFLAMQGAATARATRQGSWSRLSVLSLLAALDPAHLRDVTRSGWRSGAVLGRPVLAGPLGGGPRAQRVIPLTGGDLGSAVLAALTVRRLVSRLGDAVIEVAAFGSGRRAHRATAPAIALTTLHTTLEHPQVKSTTGVAPVVRVSLTGAGEILVRGEAHGALCALAATFRPASVRRTGGSAGLPTLAPSLYAHRLVRPQAVAPMNPVLPVLSGTRGAGGRGVAALTTVALTEILRVTRRTGGAVTAALGLEGVGRADRRAAGVASLASVGGQLDAACWRRGDGAALMAFAAQGDGQVFVPTAGNATVIPLSATLVGQVARAIVGGPLVMTTPHATPGQPSVIRSGDGEVRPLEVRAFGDGLAGPAENGTFAVSEVWSGLVGQVVRHIEGATSLPPLTATGAGEIHVRGDGEITTYLTATGSGEIHVRGEGEAAVVCLLPSGAGEIHVRGDGEAARLPTPTRGLTDLTGQVVRHIEGATSLAAVSVVGYPHVETMGAGTAQILLFAPDAVGYLNPYAEDPGEQTFVRQADDRVFRRPAEQTEFLRAA